MSDSWYQGKPAHRSMQLPSNRNHPQGPWPANALGIYAAPAELQTPYSPSQNSAQQSTSATTAYRPGSAASAGMYASCRTSRTPTTITYPDPGEEERSQLSSLHIPSAESIWAHSETVVESPPAHSRRESSKYIDASSVTRQLDHVHDYFEHDMPDYANTQMSIRGVGNWGPGQAMYDTNGVRLYKTGDYVYVRRRKEHARPTQPAEWSNWVCGRVIATHMCRHSEDCRRLFRIRPSYCYIVRYDRAPFITNGVLGPPRFGVSVFSSAGEMRMCDSPHSSDQNYRFRRSCSTRKNWQHADDPLIGGRQPALVLMQDATGSWHPGLCYKTKPPTTAGGPTLYSVRTIGKLDQGPFTLSQSHLLPYNKETVLVLRQRGKVVHIDGLPEFEEMN